MRAFLRVLLLKWTHASTLSHFSSMEQMLMFIVPYHCRAFGSKWSTLPSALLLVCDSVLQSCDHTNIYVYAELVIDCDSQWPSRTILSPRLRTTFTPQLWILCRAFNANSRATLTLWSQWQETRWSNSDSVEEGPLSMSNYVNRRFSFLFSKLVFCYQ